MDPLKLVDLDLLIEEFHKFRSKTNDLVKDNMTLSRQADMLRQSLQLAKDTETSLQSEIENFQKMLDTAQKFMINQCAMKDENARLKQELHELKLSTLELEKKYERMIQDLKQEGDMRQMHDAAEQVKLREAFTGQIAVTKETHQKVVEELKNQKEHLVRQMKELEREHDTELMKLKLEYDAKLMKLQRQLTTAGASSQAPNVSQEIFRKKLQHVQMESEKEIAGLKQTITNLQQSLNEQLQKAQATCGDVAHKRPKKF